MLVGLCCRHMSWSIIRNFRAASTRPSADHCCQHRLVPKRALVAHKAPSHQAWHKLVQGGPGWDLLSAPYTWSVTWLVAALLPSPFQARKLKKVLTP